MNKSKFHPIIMALLASLLYLGSGLGLLVFQIVNLIIKKQVINEAPLKKKDYLWLLGAIITGGIIASIILLSSLKIIPASIASLLLNFEGVATTIIEIIFFKENAVKQILIAVSLIAIASIVLSWDFSNQ